MVLRRGRISSDFFPPLPTSFDNHLINQLACQRPLWTSPSMQDFEKESENTRKQTLTRIFLRSPQENFERFQYGYSCSL